MRLDDYIVNFVHTFTVSVCMLNFMFCIFLISILLSVPDPLSDAEETLFHIGLFLYMLFCTIVNAKQLYRMGCSTSLICLIQNFGLGISFVYIHIYIAMLSCFVRCYLPTKCLNAHSST